MTKKKRKNKGETGSKTDGEQKPKPRKLKSYVSGSSSSSIGAKGGKQKRQNNSDPDVVDKTTWKKTKTEVGENVRLTRSSSKNVEQMESKVVQKVKRKSDSSFVEIDTNSSTEELDLSTSSSENDDKPTTSTKRKRKRDVDEESAARRQVERKRSKSRDNKSKKAKKLSAEEQFSRSQSTGRAIASRNKGIFRGIFADDYVSKKEKGVKKSNFGGEHVLSDSDEADGNKIDKERKKVLSKKTSKKSSRKGMPDVDNTRELSDSDEEKKKKIRRKLDRKTSSDEESDQTDSDERSNKKKKKKSKKTEEAEKLIRKLEKTCKNVETIGERIKLKTGSHNTYRRYDWLKVMEATGVEKKNAVLNREEELFAKREFVSLDGKKLGRNDQLKKEYQEDCLETRKRDIEERQNIQKVDNRQRSLSNLPTKESSWRKRNKDHVYFPEKTLRKRLPIIKHLEEFISLFNRITGTRNPDCNAEDVGLTDFDMKAERSKLRTQLKKALSILKNLFSEIKRARLDYCAHILMYNPINYEGLPRIAIGYPEVETEQLSIQDIDIGKSLGCMDYLRKICVKQENVVLDDPRRSVNPKELWEICCKMKGYQTFNITIHYVAFMILMRKIDIFQNRVIKFPLPSLEVLEGTWISKEKIPRKDNGLNINVAKFEDDEYGPDKLSDIVDDYNRYVEYRQGLLDNPPSKKGEKNKSVAENRQKALNYLGENNYHTLLCEFICLLKNTGSWYEDDANERLPFLRAYGNKSAEGVESGIPCFFKDSTTANRYHEVLAGKLPIGTCVQVETKLFREVFDISSNISSIFKNFTALLELAACLQLKPKCGRLYGPIGFSNCAGCLLRASHPHIGCDPKFSQFWMVTKLMHYDTKRCYITCVGECKIDCCPLRWQCVIPHEPFKERKKMRIYFLRHTVKGRKYMVHPVEQHHSNRQVVRGLSVDEVFKQYVENLKSKDAAGKIVAVAEEERLDLRNDSMTSPKYCIDGSIAALIEEDEEILIPGLEKQLDKIVFIENYKGDDYAFCDDNENEVFKNLDFTSCEKEEELIDEVGTDQKVVDKIGENEKVMESFAVNQSENSANFVDEEADKMETGEEEEVLDEVGMDQKVVDKIDEKEKEIQSFAVNESENSTNFVDGEDDKMETGEESGKIDDVIMSEYSPPCSSGGLENVDFDGLPTRVIHIGDEDEDFGRLFPRLSNDNQEGADFVKDKVVGGTNDGEETQKSDGQLCNEEVVETEQVKVIGELGEEKAQSTVVGEETEKSEEQRFDEDKVAGGRNDGEETQKSDGQFCNEEVVQKEELKVIEKLDEEKGPSEKMIGDEETDKSEEQRCDEEGKQTGRTEDVEKGGEERREIVEQRRIEDKNDDGSYEISQYSEQSVNISQYSQSQSVEATQDTTKISTYSSQMSCVDINNESFGEMIDENPDIEEYDEEMEEIEEDIDEKSNVKELLHDLVERVEESCSDKPQNYYSPLKGHTTANYSEDDDVIENDVALGVVLSRQSTETLTRKMPSNISSGGSSKSQNSLTGDRGLYGILENLSPDLTSTIEKKLERKSTNPNDLVVRDEIGDETVKSVERKLFTETDFISPGIGVEMVEQEVGNIKKKGRKLVEQDYAGPVGNFDKRLSGQITLEVKPDNIFEIVQDEFKYDHNQSLRKKVGFRKLEKDRLIFDDNSLLEEVRDWNPSDVSADNVLKLVKFLERIEETVGRVSKVDIYSPLFDHIWNKHSDPVGDIHLIYLIMKARKKCSRSRHLDVVFDMDTTAVNSSFCRSSCWKAEWERSVEGYSACSSGDFIRDRNLFMSGRKDVIHPLVTNESTLSVVSSSQSTNASEEDCPLSVSILDDQLNTVYFDVVEGVLSPNAVRYVKKYVKSKQKLPYGLEPMIPKGGRSGWNKKNWEEKVLQLWEGEAKVLVPCSVASNGRLSWVGKRISGMVDIRNFIFSPGTDLSRLHIDIIMEMVHGTHDKYNGLISMQGFRVRKRRVQTIKSNNPILQIGEINENSKKGTVKFSHFGLISTEMVVDRGDLAGCSKENQDAKKHKDIGEKERLFYLYDFNLDRSNLEDIVMFACCLANNQHDDGIVKVKRFALHQNKELGSGFQCVVHMLNIIYGKYDSQRLVITDVGNDFMELRKAIFEAIVMNDFSDVLDCSCIGESDYAADDGSYSYLNKSKKIIQKLLNFEEDYKPICYADCRMPYFDDKDAICCCVCKKMYHVGCIPIFMPTKIRKNAEGKTYCEEICFRCNYCVTGDWSMRPVTELTSDQSYKSEMNKLLLCTKEEFSSLGILDPTTLKETVQSLFTDYAVPEKFVDHYLCSLVLNLGSNINGKTGLTLLTSADTRDLIDETGSRGSMSDKNLVTLAECILASINNGCVSILLVLKLTPEHYVLGMIYPKTGKITAWNPIAKYNDWNDYVLNGHIVHTLHFLCELVNKLSVRTVEVKKIWFPSVDSYFPKCESTNLSAAAVIDWVNCFSTGIEPFLDGDEVYRGVLLSAVRHIICQELSPRPCDRLSTYVPSNITSKAIGEKAVVPYWRPLDKYSDLVIEPAPFVGQYKLK